MSTPPSLPPKPTAPPPLPQEPTAPLSEKENAVKATLVVLVRFTMAAVVVVVALAVGLLLLLDHLGYLKPSTFP